MKSLRLTRPFVALAFVPVLFALSACSSPQAPFYSHDSFGSDSPYQKHVPDDATIACSAAERTLLGDGYIIEGDSSKGNFKGRKAYRIDGSRSSFLEMNVVCLPDSEGSTIYANGLNSTYDLKKASSSASVGVAVLGSVSLPIGQTVDSMVKVANETITDRVFYQKFFESVEKNLDSMRVENQSKPSKVEDHPATMPVLPALPTPAAESAPDAPVVPAPVPSPVPVGTSEPAPVTPEPASSSQTTPTQSVPPAPVMAPSSEPVPETTTAPTTSEPSVVQPSVPAASTSSSTDVEKTPAP